MDGPALSGAVAARQRRERGAMSTQEDQKKQEMLERRQAVNSNYKAPAEVGGQRVAGVSVDGRGGGGPDSPEGIGGMQIQGKAPAPPPPQQDSDSEEDVEDRFERRVLKPLPPSLQGEMRELGAAITRDIFTENPNVSESLLPGPFLRSTLPPGAGAVGRRLGPRRGQAAAEGSRGAADKVPRAVLR